MLNKLKPAFCAVAVFFAGLMSSVQANNRLFDAAKMQGYKSDPAFDYLHITPEGLSLWDQLWLWFYGILGQVFDNPHGDQIGNLLFNLFLILVIVGAVVLFIRMQYGSAFSRSDASIEAAGYFGSGKQSRLNYEQLIQDAIASGDLKLAIRYLYQKTLASLHDRQHIALRSWKTGADYASEIKAEYRASFVKLKQVFEYTWYGDFTPDEADLMRCKQLSAELDAAK